ncbi:sigma-70 family RNA polymerase sigma factor [candidate division KSB1 bacterium]|nr:sigma-70 family RNA polymerase sigma factor [candidate division KSB1 bacterium]
MPAVREQRVMRTVQAYGRKLFGFVRQRVRTDEDAEDIVQEVWYQLSRVADLTQIEQVGQWLYRVARNKIIDNRRKKKPLAASDLSNGDDDDPLMEFLFVDSRTPETEFVRELFWAELLKGLDGLPEEQRAVFVWNELDGETLQAIADRTGENLKTVISRKRYAVRKLRGRLEQFRGELLSR